MCVCCCCCCCLFSLFLPLSPLFYLFLFLPFLSLSLPPFFSFFLSRAYLVLPLDKGDRFVKTNKQQQQKRVSTDLLLSSQTTFFIFAILFLFLGVCVLLLLSLCLGNQSVCQLFRFSTLPLLSFRPNLPLPIRSFAFVVSFTCACFFVFIALVFPARFASLFRLSSVSTLIHNPLRQRKEALVHNHDRPRFSVKAPERAAQCHRCSPQLPPHLHDNNRLRWRRPSADLHLLRDGGLQSWSVLLIFTRANADRAGRRRRHWRLLHQRQRRQLPARRGLRGRRPLTFARLHSWGVLAGIVAHGDQLP